MLRSVSSSTGWNITVRCGIHIHELAKELIGDDILGRLKLDNIQFVSEMTKYIMASRFIVDT